MELYSKKPLNNFNMNTITTTVDAPAAHSDELNFNIPPLPPLSFAMQNI